MTAYYWNVSFSENPRSHLNAFYAFLKLFKYSDYMQIDTSQLELITRVLNTRNTKLGIHVNITSVYILPKIRFNSQSDNNECRKFFNALETHSVKLYFPELLGCNFKEDL